MIHQPRTLKPGMRGGDILAAKRALRTWAVRTGHKNHIETPVHTAYWGDSMTAAVADFQAAHAIEREHHEVGPITWPLLTAYMDAYSAWLVGAYAKRHPAPKPENLREKIGDQLDYLCSIHDYVVWSETRPIPLERVKQRMITASWLLYTDCSGSGTAACYAAGAPDPNGLGYNGQGWTGTLLTNLNAIPPTSLQVGDPIVFGSPPGMHVVWTRHPAPAGAPISSTRVASLGHNGGNPDEPAVYDLGVFLSYFSGYAVNYLTLGLP